MSLGTFIAGRYSSVWNSVSLGIMDQGYDLQMDPKEQLINRSDAYGDMLIETIYRGVDWSMMCESLEYMAGTTGALYPFGTLGAVGVIGRLGSAIATPLVLTSTVGTPAAAAPATFTGTLTKLHPAANPRLLFNSALRTVPIRFVLYPSDAGAGVIKHFTTT